MAGVTGLRWIAGIISGLTGSMMLIVPHQFSNPSYVLFASHLEWWGVAFLLSGLGLLAAGVSQPRRPALIALHLLVGATWVLLAFGFLLGESWIAVPTWGVFGLGIAVAPFLGEQDADLSVRYKSTLPSVLGGLAATLIGIVEIVMVVTGSLGNPVYSQIRAVILYAGIAQLVSGSLLLSSALPPMTGHRPLYWAAHLMAGATFVLFGAIPSLQVRAWSGVALYGGIGLSLALAPLLQDRVRNLAPNSLPVRMSVFVSIALTITLVLAVTLATSYAIGQAASLSEEEVRSLRELTLGVLLLSLAVAVAATAYTARWAGTPLRDLAGAASKMAGGDSKALLPRSGVQEVQDLVASFDEMRSRLAAREAERDRSEQALRQSEERYRTLAEASQDYIFTLDLEGRLTYANRHSAEQHGLRPEDTVDKLVTSLFPSDEGDTIARNNRQVLESGQAAVFDQKLHVRGQEVWLSTRLVPLKDETGEVYALLGVARDITGRKQAEEALRESEGRYRRLAAEMDAIFRALPDAVVVFDETGNLVRANPAAEGISDLARAEMDVQFAEREASVSAETSDGNPFALEYLPHMRALQGEIVHGQIAVLRDTRDGRTVWAQIDAAPISGPDGGQLGAVEVIADITRLHDLQVENARLYEQGKQLSIVEERQRLARDLHDSVTQEIFGVTLYGEAMADQLAAGNVERALEFLAKLRATAQESLREMRLLVFELRPPVLEKEGLVAALQARLGSVEARGGLKVKLDGEDCPRLPSSVEQELYRIAQEALNNVLKHSEARRVEVSLGLDDGKARLEIRDNGRGFDLEAARTKGGMGLLGMEERVRRLGGALRVESATGRGSTVVVEVPVDMTEQQQQD